MIAIALSDESAELHSHGHDEQSNRLVYLIADVLDAADDIHG